jgi:hypothetical protein
MDRLVFSGKRLLIGLFCVVLLRTVPAFAISMGVTGQWDFAYGDLRATVGSDLQFIGDTATVTSFPVTNIYGQQSQVMQVGAYSPLEGIYMRHGAQPNGGGQFVNQYTVIMDIMYPSSSSDQWRALFQTDPLNQAGNDAEFYVGNNTTLPSPDGLGAAGQFDATLTPNQWYRIAFAVDLTLTNGQQLTKYVNGAKVATQALAGGIDGQYALGPTVQLFTTGIGAGFTEPGYVRGIQFVNGCMTPSMIAAMGGYNPATIQSAPNFQILSLAPSGSWVALTWSGGTAPFQVQATTNPANGSWQNVGGLTTSHSTTVPQQGAACFYRVAGASAP